MKLLSCLLMICAGLAAAEQPAKPAAHPAKKAAAKPSTAPTVPADAVQVSPGLYRWTDKSGKVWMFRKTPFGVSKWEAESENAKQAAVAEETTAKDQGDSVLFERVSPFGKHSWVRKKTELDESEQKIWAEAQAKSGSAARKVEKE